jgi:ethanolamine permease
MASFLMLRWRFPRIERPYLSPVGTGGALAAIAIAALTLVALFRNPDYSKGVVGAAIWFLLGVAYYAVWARHRLVLSPEEQTAIEHRRSIGK